MDTLLEALGDEQPRALLLTHIHLDHAAATGALVRRWPELEVYVHERGAPHLIDPSKLLASAGRLYGDADGAPLGRDRAGARGEREAAGRRRDGARHARRLHARPRLPPRLLPARGERHRLRRRRRRGPHPGDRTWSSPRPRRPTSTSRPGRTRSAIVEGWEPRAARASPTSARSTTRTSIWRWSASGCARRPGLARELDEEDYEARHRARVAEHASSEEAAAELIQCVPPQYQWRGLDRYWRKRSEREAA